MSILGYWGKVESGCRNNHIFLFYFACRNVTRQNCITKWEIDSEGNKVWAGNEDCEDVTWQECTLIDRTIDFTVPKVDCVEGPGIPYMRFVDTNKTRMINKMVCEGSLIHNLHEFCSLTPK